jgi:hypothetical protein
MNTNEKIRKALGITYTMYDNFRAACYEAWCKKYADIHALPYRALSTNDYLYNWYCDQWIIYVENQFFKDNQTLIESELNDPDTFQDLILTYPEEIERFYPNQIIYNIKNKYKNDNYTVKK